MIQATPHHLPYARRLEQRTPDTIRGIVIHCTELPDLATARTWGERIHYAGSQTGNSGHFYIDRDGTVEEWVPVDCVAHHTRGFNECSIGIELVNTGRWPNWLHANNQTLTEPYPEAQIYALTGLLAQLEQTITALRWIAGHENLDREKVPASDLPDLMVYRKRDPGPMFPWRKVLASTELERIPANGD